jgi:hypothetical protein
MLRTFSYTWSRCMSLPLALVVYLLSPNMSFAEISHMSPPLACSSSAFTQHEFCSDFRKYLLRSSIYYLQIVCGNGSMLLKLVFLFPLSIAFFSLNIAACFLISHIHSNGYKSLIRAFFWIMHCSFLKCDIFTNVSPLCYKCASICTSESFYLYVCFFIVIATLYAIVFHLFIFHASTI